MIVVGPLGVGEDLECSVELHVLQSMQRAPMLSRRSAMRWGKDRVSRTGCLYASIVLGV